MLNSNGKTCIKPNIIRDYNNGISGIDRSVQMISYYTSLRKTIRLLKKVSLHVIEIYVQNAHRIFQKVTSYKIKLIKFRKEFVVALIGEEIQPVLKRYRLQDLHYLECLPPAAFDTACYFCPAFSVQNCFRNFHKL